MTRLEKAQFFNSVVQSIAFLIGGLWVLGYKFYYTDIRKTEKEPTHVSPVMTVHIAEVVNGYIPVSVEMEIENESNREVYILPALFLAIGGQIVPASGGMSDYLRHINEIANLDQDKYADRYSEVSRTQIISGGAAFSGLQLSPDENISKTYTFFIPKNKFHTVEIVLNFWAHKGKEDLWSKMTFMADSSFTNIPCTIKNVSPWDCSPIPVGEKGVSTRNSLDLWEFEAREQIALPIENR